MKDNLWIKYRLLIIGLLLVFLSFSVEYISKNILPEFQLKYRFFRLEKEVANREQIIDQAFKFILNNYPENNQKLLDNLIKVSEKEHILFYIYENGELKLWTDSKVLPVKLNQEDNIQVLQKLPNGWYVQVNQSIEYVSLIALYRVQTNYSIENHYLKNRFVFDKSGSSFKLRLPEDKSGTVITVHDSKERPVFDVVPTEKHMKYDWLIFPYLLGGLFIFIFLVRTLNAYFRFGRKKQALLVFGMFLIVTVIGWKFFKFPKLLFDLSLFSPEVYASSRLFSSLGDLLISVFILFWAVNIITSQFPFKLSPKKWFRIVYGISAMAILILLTKWISGIIQSIVIDSNISLDMADFSGFNTNSLLTFIVFFLLLYVFNRLAFYLFKPIGASTTRLSEWLLIMGIPALSFVLFHFTGNKTSVIVFAYPALTWLLFLFYARLENITISSVLAFIMIGSGFTAHQVIFSQRQKEHENRKLLCSYIASDRDNIGEEILKKNISEIENDNYLKGYFHNPLLSKTMLLKRFRAKYFSGYFNRYDFNLFTFYPDGTPYKSETEYHYCDFIDVINSPQATCVSENIHFINSFDGAPVYLITLPIKKNDSILGRMSIEVKEKSFLEESAYPELLIDRNVVRNEALKNYSYAIYHDGSLVNQKGDFSYPLKYFPKYDSVSNYIFVKDNKFDHLTYVVNPRVAIVMTSPTKNVFSSLALFSLLFIFSTIIISSGITLRKVFKNVSASKILTFRNWSTQSFKLNLTFQSKIQLTILATIISALLLTGFATISFLKIKSDRDVEKELFSEVKTVTVSLSNLLEDYNFDIFMVNKEELTTLINKLSGLYNSDINLFDTDGNLITSSQMPIYDQKIISKKMDANAFLELRIKQKSQLIQTEKIGTTLTYKSVYSFVRNPQNQILLFVNIPYLSKEHNIKQEFSSLIVTTVNLYMFLFLLILLISFTISSTFTEPLDIIRKHLIDLQIGKLNKKIIYKSNDEIGTLINEYNKMLIKVEESAEALAKSERDAAWREMARQVAHEIKNPLTPMKLNVQHLIRAWNEKSPTLEDSIKKTTQSIIQSIESLAQIATEFSNFARMPEDENKIFILEDILVHASNLFAETEKVCVSFEPKTKTTQIFADPNQLERAITNLVKNAIQAIPESRHGLVIISTEMKENEVLITVSDNGSGINEDIRQKIFLPNFSTKTSGMGLGLAIVKRIINNMNSRIWFDTVTDEGTKFYIAIPIAVEQTQQLT